VAVTLLTAGCAPAIRIVTPDRNHPYDPVPPKAVVNLTPNFKPAEPWYVDLDGTNLTGFSPAPTPGGTSSVPLSVTGAGPHTITAQGTCGTFCAYPSDSVTFTPPALTYNSTTYVRVDKNLKQFQADNAYVGIQNYSSVPINVTIVETSFPRHVKLADGSGIFKLPGQAITVPILASAPGATTKADFHIEGDVPGPYTLSFTAPGTVSGIGAGNVVP
jgi:hypothetical protein